MGLASGVFSFLVVGAGVGEERSALGLSHGVVLRLVHDRGDDGIVSSVLKRGAPPSTVSLRLILLAVFGPSPVDDFGSDSDQWFGSSGDF